MLPGGNRKNLHDLRRGYRVELSSYRPGGGRNNLHGLQRGSWVGSVLLCREMARVICYN